jgi:membrane-associated phospholipid phosphatase
LKETVKNNPLLFIVFFIYAGIGLCLLIFFPKGGFELFVNKQNHPVWDIFFYYITYLGEGTFLVPIMVVAALRKIYYGLLPMIVFLISTIIVQLMKRIFFAAHLRPSKFFEKHIDLHFVEGLELHSFYSFPSGHSSGVFAVFFTLALLIKNQTYAVLFFLLAILVAFSRVYLLQHFFIDTYFGALISISLSLIFYFFLELKAGLSKKEILQRPLYRVFEKK